MRRFCSNRKKVYASSVGQHANAVARRQPGISNEQICILVARDRSGQTCDFVTGSGPITVIHLSHHLQPILAHDTLLVTDANRAYRAFAQKMGLSHEFVNLSAGERVRGAVHVQNVNGYHSRFHGWLQRFHGVAMRYLSNYLGWQWAIDQERIRSPETCSRLLSESSIHNGYSAK